MDFITELKQEHAQIERELLELETIAESPEINYPNLVHTYKKLHDLWNKHETKEERIFPILKHEKIVMPVKKMLFEHRELAPHKKALIDAVNSGNNARIKETLDKSLKIIIEKLKKHINLEDEILFRITLENFTQEDIRKIMDKY